MNSIIGPKLEVIFAEIGTCRSPEQCTDPPKEMQTTTPTRCYPNPLLEWGVDSQVSLFVCVLKVNLLVTISQSHILLLW